MSAIIMREEAAVAGYIQAAVYAADDHEYR